MKVCVISWLFHPYIGGSELVATELAYELKRRDFEVFVITTSSFLSSFKLVEEVENKIKIYRFYPLNFYWVKNSSKKSFILKTLWHLIDIWNFRTYIVVKKILEKEKPDIIHTHKIRGLSPAVWSAAKRLKIPIIHTLHDYELLSPKGDLYGKIGSLFDNPRSIFKIYANIRRDQSNNVDVVTSPAEFTLNKHLEAEYFRNAQKFVVRNWADTITYNDFEQIMSVRKVFLKKGIVNLLYIGRLEKIKGVHLLMDVFSKVPNKKINLHIAGEGSLLNNLKNCCNKDRRICFYGSIYNKEKEEIFKKCHILILPSIYYEISPVVIYEAYKYGLLIIASKIGGIPELVEEGKTGYLFHSENSKELQRIIEFIIENKNLIVEYNENSYKKSFEYTKINAVDEYIKIYLRCLSHS
ncbi:MAG: glycosyltransferase family 4 protein [bacterium]|nr:glycosyltransferase family 4 protein [bacterium]